MDHFIDALDFSKRVDRGDFIEWAEVHGNYYGTSRGIVDTAFTSRGIAVFDIDVQGAENVRRRIPESLAVFILPPDEHELLKRLRSRGREDEEAIQRRFAESKREIARAQAGSTFDAFVVNDTLPHAIEQVAAIVSARLPAARRA
jgi:guanylate kinase